MMICNDVIKGASDRLDGNLEPERRAEFDQHLEHCPECLSFYRTFEATVRRAGAALLTDPPPEVVEAVVRGVRRTLDQAG